MAERRIEVGKNVADLLLLLQQNAGQSQRDLSVAFTMLVKSEELPDTAKLVSIDRDAVVVDVPD